MVCSPPPPIANIWLRHCMSSSHEVNYGILMESVSRTTKLGIVFLAIFTFQRLLALLSRPDFRDSRNSLGFWEVPGFQKFPMFWDLILPILVRADQVAIRDRDVAKMEGGDKWAMLPP